MAIDRKKSARKILLGYSLYADIRPPYKILVDDSFIEFCTKRKVALQDQVRKLIGTSQVSFIITQCCWRNLIDHHQDKGSVDLARTFPKYFCTHRKPDLSSNDDKKLSAAAHGIDAPQQNGADGNADVGSCGQNETQTKAAGDYNGDEVSEGKVLLSSLECLKSYVGSSNKQKFIYCVYDRRILNDLRMRKDTPVIHFMDQQLVLAEPSKKSLYAYRKVETRKRKLPAWEKAVQEHIEGGGVPLMKAAKKRSGPRAPNPLSCKKRVSTQQQGDHGSGVAKTGKKRCRSKSHRHKGVAT